MDFLYHVDNASLTLRVIQHLQARSDLSLGFVTVIHQLNGWLLRIKILEDQSPCREDLRAFLQEVGVAYSGKETLKMALYALESGQSPQEVTQHYHVSVVAHGRPQLQDIQAFREQFIQSLGYCPATLA